MLKADRYRDLGLRKVQQGREAMHALFLEKIVEEYPLLILDDIRIAISYSAVLTREEKIFTLPSSASC
jgi:hypothetical protein